MSDTDFQALRDAGREILRQIPMKPDPHTRGYFETPEGVQIPEPIRNLRPLGMGVGYGGYLCITMHGGMEDYPKVYIYPEGFVDRGFGTRELIEGMWYHDSGCGSPQYDRYIDALIARNKTSRENSTPQASDPNHPAASRSQPQPAPEK